MAHGQLLIKSGATIKNSGYYLNLEYATISNGAAINNSTGSLVGSPVIGCNVTNSGTLAPGNSPGTFTINGDYTATSTAIHRFEVGGTANGQYDVLKTSGAVNLNGTLNVSLINGYIPTTADNITIITGTINGTFSTANIPSQYVLVYNTNSVMLKSATALPVHFVSIEAAKEKDKIKVSWKVAGEQNVAKYEIEKSVDGTTFKPIGSVTASGQNLYSYIDIQPESKSFYRIKSVDRDGSIKYSSVAIYHMKNASAVLNVYPTLVKKDVVIQHPAATAHSHITIIAMDGRTILSVIPVPGTQQTTINIPAAQAGTYIVRFENAGTILTAKFIKQ